MSLVSVIKKSPLFFGFSDSDLEKIQSVFREKLVNPGEALFYEGEDSSSLYLIDSGSFTIRKSSEKGGQDVAILGPGSHIGEMAMLSLDGQRDKRSATVEAKEAGKVLEISYEELQKALGQNPSLGLCYYRNLAVALANRIKRTTEDLSGLKSLRLRNT